MTAMRLYVLSFVCSVDLVTRKDGGNGKGGIDRMK